MQAAERLGIDLEISKNDCVFVGDSPNDAPMFAFFPHAVGVANVCSFASQLEALPAFVTSRECGDGFVELAARLLDARRG
jgi:hydroxymethylpyrimidine pyrophosphatase-like HAD family hydrolase